MTASPPLLLFSSHCALPHLAHFVQSRRIGGRDGGSGANGACGPTETAAPCLFPDSLLLQGLVSVAACDDDLLSLVCYGLVLENRVDSLIS